MSTSKKHKKKSAPRTADVGSSTSPRTEATLAKNFDYGALIPKDLDPKTREIMEKYFRNETLDLNEKTEAFDNFLLAVRKEQDEVERGEREKAIAEAAKEAETKRQMETFGFVPHPNHLSEDRQRINVGWMSSRVDCDDSTDEKIAPFCQKLGCLMYNFVSYPTGGMRRSFWSPERDMNGSYVAPQIWLPDVQLQNHLWETYVNGSISTWIDCDSEDEDFAEFSATELMKELNYAIYLGMRSIVITLRRASSPKLAAVVNRWLWTKQNNAAIWVFIPTSPEKLENNKDRKECWEVWADFRRQCANFGPQRLNVGLILSDDLDDEFIDGRLDRWLAEPIGVFLIEASAFVTGEDATEVDLCPPHEALLQRLWTSDSLRILVRGAQNAESSSQNKLAMVNACREAVKYVEKPKIGLFENIDFLDVLQTPLQPLADNLDSGIYNTFEQDRVKYDSYQAAIEQALIDLADIRDKPETLVLYVLGAGRGPLMNAAIQAERKFNDKYRGKKNRLQMQLFAVEKNPNALVTLQYVNKVGWRGRVKIIEEDMRKLNKNQEFLSCPKPDIIVSELLGSFGDNELSPECLDGVTFFLKPTTVCIPYSYTSYAAPIMSCYLHQNIRACTRSYWSKGIPGVGREDITQEEDGSYSHKYHTTKVDSNLDQLYVVYLRHYCPLGETHPVFTFNHPNTKEESNERATRITFDNFTMPSEIMGFAGYFSLKLYKDIMISIEPKTHTHQMYSWFSAVIPLRQMERIYPGDKVTLDMKRKVDSGGVWYEWFAEIESKDGNIRKTMLQNENGVNNYLRFFDTEMASAGASRLLQKELACVQPCRLMGRRAPKPGKPPILPPSKKVLYRVVHVPWQKPEEVKELLWRRIAYNNAATSLREVFKAELQEKANAGQGLESMREEEEAEFNQLIQENEELNTKKAAARAERDKEEWKKTKLEILLEIEESLQKQRAIAAEATEEVRAAIERSANFVNKDNLETKIREALEHPTVYDFAIDRQGNKYMDPVPVKYQEGVPTRQKGRLYDKTLGSPEHLVSEKAATGVA